MAIKPHYYSNDFYSKYKSIFRNIVIILLNELMYAFLTEGKSMAFFGIFIVMWLLIIILIVIGCLLLFVFIPCLVLAIINLVQGVRHNWPKRNIVLLAITGTISVIFIILIGYYLVWRFMIYVPPYEDGSTSESIDQIYYLGLYLKYLIF